MAGDATMDIDMDMDIDVDLDLDAEMDPELARMKEEAAKLNALPSTALEGDVEAMNGVEGVEEGEVGPDEIATTKIHIDGLEQLTTQDIENFAQDNYRSDSFNRVQWIDDNSANLIYDSEAAASAALQAFSAVPTQDALEPRRAVTLATHPHLELYVRMARVTDIKEPGAAKRSRFYLLHPELDPENRPKRRRFDGPRRGGYRRSGYQDVRASRRSSQEEEAFDVDLYDDNPRPVEARRARRASDQSVDDLMAGRRNRRQPQRQNEDLFAGRPDERLRNRSASPARDGDGRFGFSDEQPYRQTARRRSPPPLRSRSSQENYSARDVMKKELFPSKKTGTALTNGHGNNHIGPVELFPQQPTSSKSKDLFPEKVSHRRQDAKDLHPDEVANAIGKCNLQHSHDTFAYSSFTSGRRPENARDRNASGKPRDLFSRIDGGPGLAMNTTAGRLSERPSSEGNAGGGFSIRGAGEDKGFSIRGASRDTPAVKELFPTRPGAGTDLFAGKMRSRAAPRRRAEDFV